MFDAPASPCPVILHFTGGSWNTITPPSGSYILNSVFMVSPSEGWAVGCSGTLDPNQCKDINEANPEVPGGGKGIILHYTVTGGVGTWAIFPSPPTPPLNSIFMVSPNEGWAVGDGTDFASATYSTTPSPEALERGTPSLSLACHPSPTSTLSLC